MLIPFVPNLSLAKDFSDAGSLWAPPASSAMVENSSMDEFSQAEPSCQRIDLLILRANLNLNLAELTRKIEENGGCARHIFPPIYILGYIPDNVLDYLNTKGWLDKIYTPNAVQEATKDATLPNWLRDIWLQTILPTTSSVLDESNAELGKPLNGDVRRLAEEAVNPTIQAESGYAPGYYQTSEFMAGKIAVGIIYPESNGTLDPNSENWNQIRMDKVVSKIQSAMNWWATQNPNGKLSFIYDIHKQVATKYEPILSYSTQDYLWINDVFSKLNFTSTSLRKNTFDYLNSLRNVYHTDWAVVAFVVDSYNDADGSFPDGYFAYTYVNPGLIVMTYDNDGWGIDRMDSVMAHEFSHDFGADDEYCEVGYSCCWGGLVDNYSYLYIPNSNCEAGCDNNRNGICDGNDSTPNSNCQNCPSCVRVPCLMRDGTIDAGLDVPTK
ncbi:MAG: hypothetical protein ACPL7A_00690, partial [Anaerolineales bacterium]